MAGGMTWSKKPRRQPIAECYTCCGAKFDKPGHKCRKNRVCKPAKLYTRSSLERCSENGHEVSLP